MPKIAQYPLDGDATDAVGSNDGSVSGASFVSDGILGTQCASFDGTDDDIDLGNPAVFNDSELVVFSLWINPDNFDNIQYVAAHGTTSGNKRWFILVDTDGTVDWHVSPDGDSHSNQLTSNSSLQSGSWQHLYVIYDNNTSTQEIWIDGSVDSSTSNSGTMVSSSESMWIASRDGNNTFDGDIDDVRIYDHALTPAEVRYLYDIARYGDYTTSVKTQ